MYLSLESALSGREREVLDHIQLGLTNRQIASALHYSPKTVDVYLSRLYRKTNSASRIELIRAVDSDRVTVPV